MLRRTNAPQVVSVPVARPCVMALERHPPGLPPLRIRTPDPSAPSGHRGMLATATTHLLHRDNQIQKYLGIHRSTIRSQRLRSENYANLPPRKKPLPTLRTRRHTPHPTTKPAATHHRTTRPNQQTLPPPAKIRDNKNTSHTRNQTPQRTTPRLTNPIIQSPCHRFTRR
jgi:hypothetical protein